MSKMKRLYKANIEADAAIKAIYISYFVSIGLNSGSNHEFESAEYKADFAIKFGRNDYRRAAWLGVRDEVEKQVSAPVYSTLNTLFAFGSAARFIEAFDYKTRLNLSGLNGYKEPS